MSNYWLAVILVAAGSFSFRFVFLAGDQQKQAKKDGGFLNNLLPYIPAAVLAGLITPSIFGNLEFNQVYSYGPIVAALAALAASCKFHKALLTIAVGLIVLHLWQVFLG